MHFSVVQSRGLPLVIFGHSCIQDLEIPRFFFIKISRFRKILRFGVSYEALIVTVHQG